MRLAKYLASCGVASRRKAEDMIQMGRISVDSVTVLSPATDVTGEEQIAVDGKVLSPESKVYYLLNKPAGYTSTNEDAHAKQLITELVPKKPSVWPVGRLDRETSGLIILTNDGELTQKLTHPSQMKEKEYVVKVTKPLSKSQITSFSKGFELDDGPFHPDSFKEIENGKYRIIIHEGRNRLIRRSFEHFDTSVIALRRTRIASLSIGTLKEGKYRMLSQKELEGLRNA